MIEPNVVGVERSDFARTRDLANLGEQAALSGTANLKSPLAKLDDRLFATPQFTFLS